MKILAVSTPLANKQINFGAKKSFPNREKENTQCINDISVSNSVINNAVKAMVLIPVTTLTLSSCGKDDVEVEDYCRTSIFINKPDKPDVPEIKDTLYMGHIYNLDKVSTPVRDSNGNIIGSVTIPKSQAYVPASFVNAPVNKTLNNIISTLGLTPAPLAPVEGASKNPAENIPLQIVYSNPKTQTVTAIKLDGFKSSDKSFAYNSYEYNKSNSLKSSTHYDFTILDYNSVFVEKYDNFRPENGVKNEILRVNKGNVERYVSAGDNSYTLANIYSEGNNSNSIFIDSENSSSEITDIKLTSSSR